jgi:hypothetical protein
MIAIIQHLATLHHSLVSKADRITVFNFRLARHSIASLNLPEVVNSWHVRQLSIVLPYRFQVANWQIGGYARFGSCVGSFSEVQQRFWGIWAAVAACEMGIAQSPRQRLRQCQFREEVPHRRAAHLPPASDAPRARIYDEAVLQTLTLLWEAADRICGKRLKAAIPALLDSMERHGHLKLEDLSHFRCRKAKGET